MKKTKGTIGEKTWIAKGKEIAVRNVMKCGKSEAEAIMIVESWSNRQIRDDKYVVCDVMKKLILRDKCRPIWHPYIEKAILFDSIKDAEDCLVEMTQKKLIEFDERLWPCDLYDRIRYSVGSVKEMMDRHCKYGWHRPFYAQTGIRNQIELKGKKEVNA